MGRWGGRGVVFFGSDVKNAKRGEKAEPIGQKYSKGYERKEGDIGVPPRLYYLDKSYELKQNPKQARKMLTVPRSSMSFIIQRKGSTTCFTISLEYHRGKKKIQPHGDRNGRSKTLSSGSLDNRRGHPEI